MLGTRPNLPTAIVPYLGSSRRWPRRCATARRAWSSSARAAWGPGRRRSSRSPSTGGCAIADFHVIPVLLPGAERPRRGEVAHLEFLHQRLVGRVPQDARRRAGLPTAWSGGSPGSKPEPPGGSRRCEGVCPYRGLEAFGPDDARFFFGRENLTDWLVSDLRREVRVAAGSAVPGGARAVGQRQVVGGAGRADPAAQGGGDRGQRPLAGRDRAAGGRPAREPGGRGRRAVLAGRGPRPTSARRRS